MKTKLSLVVFLCGASTMIMELAGSRILAPYVGTSIFVWTNLIGVILASLSVGYAFGGRLADKHSDSKMLSALIFGSAIWVALIALLGDAVLVLVQKAFFDVRIAAFVASVILFSIPSFLLGSVLPYAAKLNIRSIDQSGKTVGNLYAISTAGSIAGTFLAGLYLLSYYSHSTVLYFVSALLMIASVLSAGKSVKSKTFLAIVLIVAGIFCDSFSKKIFGADFVDAPTPYNRVWVYKQKIQNTPPFWMMQINNETSSMHFLNSDELAAPYTRYYRMTKHFRPDTKHTLMIGGAGYSYPQDYLKNFPLSHIDVVEIDPGVTKLAKKYFGLRPDSRMSIFHEDARIFLNNNKTKYDVIYGDAFHSFLVPFHLVTKQAMQKIFSSLDDQGIFMMNVISSIDGEDGRMLRSQVATLKEYFPQVYVFCVNDPENSEVIQNLMVVALKDKKVPKFYSADQELNGYLEHLYIKDIEQDMPVLTDDFAPVELYSSSFLKLTGKRSSPMTARYERLIAKWFSSKKK